MRRIRLDKISSKWLGWALFLYVLKTLVFSHVFASELPKCPPDGPYHNCFGTYIWVSGHKKGDKYIGVYKNTENYYYAKGFDCIVWRKQYRSVFNEFEDTTFYWVCKDIDNQIGKDVFEQHSNVKFITYEELHNNIR